MSWSIRRAVLVLTAVSVLGCMAFLGHAYALKRVARPVPVGPAPAQGPITPSSKELAFGSITLPKDDKMSNKIEAALDYIKVENWEKSCEALQKLLSQKDLAFARVSSRGPDGKVVDAYINARVKAEQLLAGLDEKGKQYYQATYGPKGEEKLREALKTNNLHLMGEVFAEYFYTDAGAKATEWLALHFLDRGALDASTRYFHKLLNRDGADKIAPLTLTKAAYAFHQAKNFEDEKLAYKLLDNANIREIAIGGVNKGLDEVKEFIAQASHSSVTDSASISPNYRNNPARTGISRGGPPFLQKEWAFDSNYEKGADDAKKKIEEARRKIEDKKQPLLTTYFPVTATASKTSGRQSQIIVRSYYGIHAIDVKTGKVVWQQPCAWSLQGMIAGDDDDTTSNGNNDRKRQALDAWFNLYVPNGQRPEMLFENSVIGSASSDGLFVYAIDDLALPPPQTNNFNPWGGGMAVDNQFGPVVQAAIHSNRLQAYQLSADGKLAWEANGPDEKEGPLKGCFFLGPPLPLGGKIYVLTEKQQELKVLCIDPAAKKGDTTFFEPRVVSAVTLGTTKTKLEDDIQRRTNAAFLAYGEGVMVVPTNAGAVFGIDLLSGNLLWAYPYHEGGSTAPKPMGPGVPGGVVFGPDGRPIIPIPENNGWKVAPPIIVDGKVVFTAPDARSLHCFSLKDGTPLWTRPRGTDDLYLGGVVKGKVIVVGKKRTRGLNLETGEVAWDLETGTPSGQGVSTEDFYFLPLAKAVRTGKPEICTIDVEHGLVHAHTQSRPTPDHPTPDVPGNLLFFEGHVVSQTPTQVICYPQLKYKMAEMDAAIARNPDDPKGLTYRGELRLDQGDLKGAIQDLSRALKNAPPPDLRETARGKLYDTLTEYFQRDFNSAEEFLKEYEELCKVDTTGLEGEELKSKQAEERKRRSRFLWLLAKGRESQGNLLEAFEKYKEFSKVASKDGELTPVIDDPTVQAAPEVWARGRVARMMANATPEQRKPLEEMINHQWEELRSTNDTEALRGFVDMFGSGFKAGKEARLILAERLMKDGSSDALLKAEQQLNLLRGPSEEPEMAARAVETLARLYLKKRLIEDAAYCYRLLGRKYADVKVTDGKTGAELYDDMIPDKRLQGHLDEAEPFTGGEVKFEIDAKGTPLGNNHYIFSQVGERLPFFDRYEVRYQLNSRTVDILDRKTGNPEPIKRLELNPQTQPQMTMLLQNYGQTDRMRFPYQTMGHLIILPMLNMVYAIDPVSRQLVWEKNLYGGDANRNPTVNWGGVTVDPRDGSLQVAHTTGWIQRVGRAGPLGPRIFCVQTPEALVGLDPLTGRELWRRTSITPRYQVRGDDEYVYIIDQGDNNSIDSTRVIRAADGATVRMRAADGTSVEVPGFAHAYEKRLRMFDHYLLVSDTDVRGQPELRLYNILTGKNEWKETFPVNSKVLQSQDPDLTGVVEPNGEIRILDVHSGKPVFGGKAAVAARTKIDENELRTAQTMYLLADASNFYIVCSQPVNGTGPFLNVMPFNDLRMLPINGPIYFFDRKKGTLKNNTGESTQRQMILLNHFRDLPFMVLTARHNETTAGGFGNMNVGNVKLIDKRTGRLKLDPNDNGIAQFHTFNVDLRGSRLEMISSSHTVRVFVDFGNGAAPAEKKVKPATEEARGPQTQSQPPSQPLPRPGRRLGRPQPVEIVAPVVPVDR